jgi:hypothetical protein
VPLTRRAATTVGRSAGAAPSGRYQTQTKEKSDSLHNQWQMDNFFTPKVAKSRGGVAFSFILDKK